MKPSEIVEECYQGGYLNPGKEGRKIVELKRGDVFDINVCTEPECDCGWNISIGSEDRKLLGEIIALLVGEEVNPDA